MRGESVAAHARALAGWEEGEEKKEKKETHRLVDAPLSPPPSSRTSRPSRRTYTPPRPPRRSPGTRAVVARRVATAAIKRLRPSADASGGVPVAPAAAAAPALI